MWKRKYLICVQANRFQCVLSIRSTNTSPPLLACTMDTIKWATSISYDILSHTDSNEPSLHPFTLHFHHSHLKQRTRICNHSTLQTAFSGSSWLRACCKEWSWRSAADRGQIYQSVITFLGTGKLHIKFNSSFYSYFWKVVCCKYVHDPLHLALWLFNKHSEKNTICISVFIWVNSMADIISLASFHRAVLLLYDFLFKFFSGNCWNVAIGSVSFHNKTGHMYFIEGLTKP